MKQKTNEQWEYKTHTVESSRYEDSVELKRLGDKGWEAYAVTELANVYAGIATTYYLKRRKGGRR